MIKPVSQLVHLMPMINQEANAQPGEGLTVTQTVTYFVLLPVALFVVIGALAWIGSAPKKAKKDVVSSIPDDGDFITTIA